MLKINVYQSVFMEWSLIVSERRGTPTLDAVFVRQSSNFNVFLESSLSHTKLEQRWGRK